MPNVNLSPSATDWDKPVIFEDTVNEEAEDETGVLARLFSAKSPGSSASSSNSVVVVGGNDVIGKRDRLPCRRGVPPLPVAKERARVGEERGERGDDI